ncbi:MAG: universal stress protein [Lapillicoccus sp.]
MTSATAAPLSAIVVGLDGSGHGDQALDWAIAEATARHLPLHLVHAHETTVTVWSPMVVVPSDLDDDTWVIDAALARVRAAAPDLEVTAVSTTGPASAALENATRGADTLVVGARGRGVVGSILLGSTSLHVAGHAQCPVVVVRAAEPASDSWTDTAPQQPGRTVVVGYDGSPRSVDALGYAFAAAALRGLPLDVVTCWEPEELATYRLSPTVADEVRAAKAGHHRDLALAAASPWREKYPDVEIRIHVTTDHPAVGLVSRSFDAALVVVGSRGLGSVRGPLLGSVSSAVLHGCLRPVAVVRSPSEDHAAGRRG